MPEIPDDPPLSLPPIQEAPKRRPTGAESTPGGVAAPLGMETYETQPLPALDALLQTNFIEDLKVKGLTSLISHAETHMAGGYDEVHSLDTLSVYDFFLMRKGHETDTGIRRQDEIEEPDVPTTQVPQDGSYVAKEVPLIRLDSDQSTDPERIRVKLLPNQVSGSFLTIESDQALDAKHGQIGLRGHVAVPSGVAGYAQFFTHAVSIHSGSPHDHSISLNPWNHALELPNHDVGFRIANVTNPVLGDDAATKDYVDTLVGGVSDAPFLTLGLDGDLSNEYSILEADESDLPDDDIHWKWNRASDRKMLIENVGAGGVKIDLKGDLDLTGLVDGVDVAARDHNAVTIHADAAHALSTQELQAVLAANGQTGHMSGAMFDKLDAIAAGADVTADNPPQAHAAAKHNAATLPASANENLGAFYLDIDDIAVPANPGAGIRRLFVNTATGEVSVRTNAGATVSLEAGGYVDADAIAAIEAEDPLDLAGVVNLAKYLQFDEIAAPGAGAANKGRLYSVDRGGATTLEWVDSGGVTAEVTHPPAVFAVRTAAQTMTHNAWTTVQFNAADLFDTDAMHDPSTNNTRLTATTAGIYAISGWLSWLVHATGLRSVRIFYNNTTQLRQVTEAATPATVGNDQEVFIHYNLAATDYVELEGWHNRGAGLNIDAAHFSMVWVAPTP